MRKKTLFARTSQALDLTYLALHDDPSYESDRSYVDDLWHMYAPYADRDFSTQITQEFHARFWEMHLTCTLIKIGLPVQRKIDGQPEGPDICIAEPTQTVWIEAIQISRGTGSNAVTERRHNIWTKAPENKILLRYTGAIKEKYKQYQQYISKSIIRRTDPYVIAINSSNLKDTFWADDYPRIVKSIFGIGHQRWKINSDTNKATFSGYDSQPSISTAKGSPVSTEAFITGEYKEVSGLIFSSKNIEQRPDLRGKDFTFIHNPTATNQIGRGWLQIGREYWFENDELKFKQW